MMTTPNGRKPRLILVGRHYSIEPLGILHLLGLAEAEGWDAKTVLIRDFDFQPLFDEVAAFQPDLVGFSIWTGYHVQAFGAADIVREMGVNVVIGGPHATYFAEDCAKHADWVIKGEAFRFFRKLLAGELPRGLQHDPVRVAEGFPVPARRLLYDAFPDYARSPIKSMMATVGCPFECSYCYAPVYNDMYGGYEGNERPVEQLIAEARLMRDRYPLSMIYFQDDIFGFKVPWLREFARRWKEEIGVPWHCQIRLELTRHDVGLERLDLFREAGCTGITLAVESGNDFLRRYVLKRGMSDELIQEGVERIQARGLTLRLQQILMVPFSDLETDLQTLALNVRLAPEMGWTSILAPYGGTAMGTIASKYELYTGSNDDLDDRFFSRSVLRHVAGGPAAIEAVVRQHTRGEKHNPLVDDFVIRRKDALSADVFVEDPLLRRPRLGAKPIAELRYLDDEQNNRYCDQGVMLQRIFDWCTRVPEGDRLAREFVHLPNDEWTWKRFGQVASAHAVRIGAGDKVAAAVRELGRELGTGPDPAALPAGVRDNPIYFTYLPSGPAFARELTRRSVFDIADQSTFFETLGTRTRHWLYDHWLYKVKATTEPLALQGV